MHVILRQGNGWLSGSLRIRRNALGRILRDRAARHLTWRRPVLLARPERRPDVHCGLDPWSARLDRNSGANIAMSQDTLSDVLRSVRLRGAVFFYISGGGEWAAEAPAAHEIAPLLMRGVEHVMEYHAVAQGSCWAAMPGGPAVRLSAGDVVMFPHGDAHVVSSAPGMRGDPPDLRWFGESTKGQLPLRIAYNGAKSPSTAPSELAGETTIVCGFLGCDLQPFNPLIAALPRLLHLRAPRRRRLDCAVHAPGRGRIARQAPGRRGDAGAHERDDVRRRGAALHGRVFRWRAPAGWPACAIAWSGARWRCCTNSRRETGRSMSSDGASACRARRCTNASFS